MQLISTPSRRNPFTGSVAVWLLGAIGIAVSGYAAYQSWKHEADGHRLTYMAAADNRLLAVQHGTSELLTNLQGIAFAMEGHRTDAFGSLVRAFIPAGYKRGEIMLLDSEDRIVTQNCLGDCETVRNLRHESIRQTVESARLSRRVAATPPLAGGKRSGRYTAWFVVAVPVSGERTLLAKLDAEDLVESSLAYLRPGGVDVYLFDQTNTPELAYFHRSRKSKTPLNGDPRQTSWSSDHHTGTFPVAGRVWAIHNEPVVPIQEQVGITPWVTLAMSLFLTASVAGALATQIGRRRSVEAEVTRRTLRLQKEVEEHKRTQSDLSTARDAAMESSRLKSAFLANVSHEIRTPLNGISGFASVLLDSPLTHEQREQAETIVGCATDLATLISDILDMSRIEAGKIELYPQECHLNHLLTACEASIQPQAQAKGLRMSVTTGPGLPETIVVDEGRLKQVLRNLLTNAVKFTDQGRVTLRCQRDQDHIRFEVEDTGRGIPPDARDRLFRRFTQVDGSFQRLHGGLGLGLAITKELTELMGGRIGVESELGRGSRFWVEIPVCVLDLAIAS